MPKVKNGRGSKAAAIRKLLEQNPKLKTSVVVNRLSAKGIEVSASQVAGIRNRLLEKEEEMPHVGSYDGIEVEAAELGELVCNSQHRPSSVSQVVRLASELGVDRMRTILDTYEEVQSLLSPE